MPSPFPGMDPYLERHWPDVRLSLTAPAADWLNKVLPDDLVARIDERIGVEPEDKQVDDCSPRHVQIITEPWMERFIEIREISGWRLITVIEFLSPSNKLKPGVDEFLVKRNQLLAGGVNVVEIDLVRVGNRDRLLPRGATPAAARSEYRVVHFLPNGEVWLHPMPLREPLPTIRIPLRPTDEPAELSLQPLLDDAYKNGRYGRTLDYSRPPEPPLEGEDADWAAGLRGGVRGDA